MSPKGTTATLGVDGCKAGWCCAFRHQGEPRIALFETVGTLARHFQDETIWIDMPIGLGSAHVDRNVEPELRKQLKHRSSSVFTPPVREAIYADDYNTAKDRNREVTGKAISIQAWNIVPKIKELDHYLINHPKRIPHFVESHPEWCFAQLNQGDPLTHAKRHRLGQEERLALLGAHDASFITAYHTACSEYPRKEVQRDDIIDALVLLLTSEMATMRGMATLPQHPTTDDHSLPMRIGYARS